MRIDEIAAAPLMEMAYARRKAEMVITGLERPINEHLLKLAAVAEGRDEAHWRSEVTNWLDEVAEIRLKPSARPGPASFYYRILYAEPFEGTEEANVAARLRRLGRQYRLSPSVDALTLVQRLRAFHKGFSEACAGGRLTITDVAAMVDNFGGL